MNSDRSYTGLKRLRRTKVYLSDQRIRRLKRWADGIVVIKYLYIGYHVWDIPEGLDTAPGAKYAYAVSGDRLKMIVITMLMVNGRTGRIALQSYLGPRQNVDSTLSPAPSVSKVSRA